MESDRADSGNAARDGGQLISRRKQIVDAGQSPRARANYEPEVAPNATALHPLPTAKGHDHRAAP